MSEEQELKTSNGVLVYKSIDGDESADFEIDFGLVDQPDSVGEKLKISIGHIRSDADEMKVAGIGEVTGRRGGGSG